MSSQMIGVLLGGVLTAVFYGVSGIFMKASNDAGIGTGAFLIALGFGIAIVGLTSSFFGLSLSFNRLGSIHAVLAGIVWGIGTCLFAIALTSFATPAVKMFPLQNIAPLIAVLLALWLFSEWQQVKVVQLLLGTVFVVVGGILVARA